MKRGIKNLVTFLFFFSPYDFWTRRKKRKEKVWYEGERNKTRMWLDVHVLIFSSCVCYFFYPVGYWNTKMKTGRKRKEIMTREKKRESENIQPCDLFFFLFLSFPSSVFSSVGRWNTKERKRSRWKWIWQRGREKKNISLSMLSISNANVMRWRKWGRKGRHRGVK